MEKTIPMRMCEKESASRREQERKAEGGGHLLQLALECNFLRMLTYEQSASKLISEHLAFAPYSHRARLSV